MRKKKEMKQQYDLYLPEHSGCLPCRIILSQRKSISIQVKADGDVVVRAPYGLSLKSVGAFIESKRDWIWENHQKMKEHSALLPSLSPEESRQLTLLEKQLRREAGKIIPLRVQYFHQYTGGTYTSISIRNQKTRWGSCSSRGGLSFNYRLLLAPPHILDYVIVHELCHLNHMNHSKDFWNMVESILPDYKQSRAWLKDHGQNLSLETAITLKRETQS